MASRFPPEVLIDRIKQKLQFGSIMPEEVAYESYGTNTLDDFVDVFQVNLGMIPNMPEKIRNCDVLEVTTVNSFRGIRINKKKLYKHNIGRHIEKTIVVISFYAVRINRVIRLTYGQNRRVIMLRFRNDEECETYFKLMKQIA